MKTPQELQKLLAKVVEEMLEAGELEVSEPVEIIVRPKPKVPEQLSHTENYQPDK